MRLAYLAKRNLLRHKASTLQNIIGVIIPVFILSFLFSMIGGMENDLKYIIGHYLSGDLRIRNAEYSKNEVFNPTYFLVNDIAAKEQAIAQIEGVSMVSSRLIIPITLVQNEEFEPLTLTGYNIDNETKLYDLASFIVEGRIPMNGQREAIVGSETAKLLSISVGDKITFTGSTALRGTNAMTVTVVGIVEYPILFFNTRRLYMPLDTAQRFFRSPNQATEIDILVDPQSTRSLKDIKRDIAALSVISDDSTEHDIQVWNEISSFAQTIKVARIIYIFLGAFFCLLGSLVIYNTVYMSLFNRYYEFGVMNANGFSIKMLQKIVKYEVLMTVSFGAIIGLSASLLFIGWLHRVGLDLAVFGNKIDANALFSTVLHPTLTPFWTVFILVYTIGICYGVATLPVFTIRKKTPLQLLKSE